MKVNRHGVHSYHCCVLHGCKYGDDDCPVVSGEVLQEYTCESCEDSNYNKLEDVLQHHSLLDQIKQAKSKGQQQITVDVAILEKVLNFGL